MHGRSSANFSPENISIDFSTLIFDIEWNERVEKWMLRVCNPWMCVVVVVVVADSPNVIFIMNCANGKNRRKNAVALCFEIARVSNGYCSMLINTLRYFPYLRVHICCCSRWPHACLGQLNGIGQNPYSWRRGGDGGCVHGTSGVAQSHQSYTSLFVVRHYWLTLWPRTGSADR